MKTTKFLVLLLLGVIGVSLFVSCEHDDPDEDDYKSLPKLISQYPWQLESKIQKNKPYIDLNEDGKINSKDWNLMSSDTPESDDLYFFRKDGTFERNSFNEVSAGEEPNTVIVKGKWRIKGKRTLIITANEEELILEALPILPFPVPSIHFDSKEKFKDMEYTIEWGFQAAGEKLN